MCAKTCFDKNEIILKHKYVQLEIVNFEYIHMGQSLFEGPVFLENLAVPPVGQQTPVSALLNIAVMEISPARP